MRVEHERRSAASDRSAIDECILAAEDWFDDAEPAESARAELAALRAKVEAYDETRAALARLVKAEKCMEICAAVNSGRKVLEKWPEESSPEHSTDAATQQGEVVRRG